ncbi:MAG: hypothetical protein AABX47_00965 [Nanoarchaeota archaeon]
MADIDETGDTDYFSDRGTIRQPKKPDPRSLDNIIQEIYQGVSNVAGLISPTFKETIDKAAGMTLSVIVGYYSGWLVDQARNTIVGQYIGLDAGIQAMHELSGGRMEAASYAIIGTGLGIAAYATTIISKAWHNQERTETR